MSKEKLKGRCILCKNLVVQEAPRYPVLPAPELPFPPECKCKSTHELIEIDDLEIERECEHFMETEDIIVLTERRFKLGI